MKLKLQELRDAYKVVDNVDANEALSSSQFVRLLRTDKALSMTMTGILWAGASIDAADKGKWTAFADRRALKAFLDTASGTDVELYYAKDTLTLKAGQRLEIAAHTPISGYSQWTPKSTFELSDAEKAALKVAVKYLPRIKGTENMEAVYFEKGYGIIASDSLSMFVVLGKIAATFFLPNAVANVLAGMSGKLAADNGGIGAAMPNGFIYQALSNDLDRYPVDPCKKAIANAQAAKPLAVMTAEDLISVLGTANRFLMDKMQSAKIEPEAKSLLLTVDMAAGKFQRSIPVTGKVDVKPTAWPIKSLMPWLEYISAIDSAADVEYVRHPLPNGSPGNALRYSNKGANCLLLFADV